MAKTTPAPAKQNGHFVLPNFHNTNKNQKYCLICAEKVKAKAEKPRNDHDLPRGLGQSSTILYQILGLTKIPYFAKTLTFANVDFCTPCLRKMNQISEGLEQLQNLEHKVLNYKHEIEVKLKESCKIAGSEQADDVTNGNGTSGSDDILAPPTTTTNILRNKIVAELKSRTITTMMHKVLRKRVGKHPHEPQDPPEDEPQNSSSILRTDHNNVATMTASAARNLASRSRSPEDHCSYLDEDADDQDSDQMTIVDPSSTLTSTLEQGDVEEFIQDEDIVVDVEDQKLFSHPEEDPDPDHDHDEAEWTLTMTTPHTLQFQVFQDEPTTYDDDDDPASQRGHWRLDANLEENPDPQEPTATSTSTTYICNICGDNDATFPTFDQFSAHFELTHGPAAETETRTLAPNFNASDVDLVDEKTEAGAKCPKFRCVGAPPVPTPTHRGRVPPRRPRPYVPMATPKRRLKRLPNLPFQCQTCGRTFAMQTSLLTHVSHVHLGQSRFPCKICSTRCGSLSELNKHMFCHSEERNFKCNLCTKEYKFKNRLITHKKNFHGEKPYGCGLCGLKFNQVRGLRSHEQQMHGVG